MTQGTLRLGDLTVDLELREVARGSDVVRLSKNEAGLLGYLAAAQGAPVSRERVHTDVFGYAPHVVSRAADFAVHRLRKKLEPDPATPTYLLTVPGVGFRLVSERASPGPLRSGPPLLLPAETTTFIGRDREIAEVLDALAGSSRPVSLVGPGGVGKSRLAREVARAWWERERAAVRFCTLAEASDEAGLVGSVAALFDVPPAGLDDAVAASGTALLVLDNLEQIVEVAAPAIQRWLTAAPELCVLTTTRERLRLPGEHLVELGPLAGDDGPRLFVDRARGVGADLAADDDIPERVAELDGQARALEVAPPRASTLSPAELLARLRTTGSVGGALRGVEPRHASMERVLQWSWSLLDEAEQLALSRLASFRGGFDLALAEAVTGSAELVEALRDKSLIAQRGARLDLLQTVRDFAEARDPDRPETWRRHADAIHARHEPVMWRHLVEQHPDTLPEERENLVAAIGRADGLRLAQLASVAHRTWRGERRPELEALLERALSVPELPELLRRRLELLRLQIAVYAGRIELAPDAERVASEAHDVGAPIEEALAWSTRASLLRHVEPEEAHAACAAAREALGDVPLGPLHVRVAMLQYALDHDRAPSADPRPLQRVAALADRAGAPWLQASILVNVAAQRGHARDPAGQREAAQRALALPDLQPLDAARARYELAGALRGLGRLDEAAELCDEVIAAGALPALLHDVHLEAAGIAFARNELEDAEHHVHEARGRTMWVREPWRLAAVDLWEALVIWARWGDVAEARRLLDRAEEAADGRAPVLITSRRLALLAHTDPDGIEAAFDALAADLEARGLPRESLAVDRAHLPLAAGGIVDEVQVQLEARADDDFHVACSRVLLAAAVAELQHA